MNVSNVYTAGQSVVDENGVTWASCNELPPNYQFSDTGLVRKFISQSDYVFVSPRINNYPTLSINGKQHPFHRIIASLFVDVPNSSYTALGVIHKDGDISNNCASNLEWSVCRSGKKSEIDLSKQWIVCPENHKLYSSITCVDYALGIPREAIADALKTGISVCGLHFYLDVPDESYSESDAVMITASKVKEMLFNSASIEDYKNVIKTLS